LNALWEATRVETLLRKATLVEITLIEALRMDAIGLRDRSGPSVLLDNNLLLLPAAAVIGTNTGKDHNANGKNNEDENECNAEASGNSLSDFGTLIVEITAFSIRFVVRLNCRFPKKNISRSCQHHDMHASALGEHFANLKQKLTAKMQQTK